MEKFLVDRDEVLSLIVSTYVDLYHDGRLTVANFSHAITDRILALDAQKIEGIDLGKGDGKVFGD